MQTAKKIKRQNMNVQQANDQQLKKAFKNISKGKKQLIKNNGIQHDVANHTSSLPSTVEAARKLYTESDDNIIDNYTNTICATKEIAKTVEDLHKLEKLKKQLLANEDRLKLEVMNYMQMHAYLSFNGFTIASWKSYTRKSFEQTKFKDDFPDLYSSYLQDISIRSFRLL